MKGYKGMDQFMRCKGFQYEVGMKYRVFGAYRTPISEEVTVWMPLPEPYTTQSNDSNALDALGKGEQP